MSPTEAASAAAPEAPPAASSPIPAAARMSAQARAAQRVASDDRSSTMNGPRTSMCQTAYWSTITHAHVPARNSAQPSERNPVGARVVLGPAHGEERADAYDERVRRPSQAQPRGRPARSRRRRRRARALRRSARSRGARSRAGGAGRHRLRDEARRPG